MIRRILLIGRQEFLKYVTRRGFIISLLMFPLIFALAAAVPGFTASHPRTSIVAVIDRAGGYAGAVAAAVARDRAKSELSALAAYAREFAGMKRLALTDPALAEMLKAPERIASVKAFEASGGWRPALARLSPLLKRDAPTFAPPAATLVLVPPPPGLAADLARGSSAVALAYLDGARSVAVQGASKRLSAVLLIPRNFGPGKPAAAQYWTNDDDQPLDLLRWALTDAFRVRTLQALVPPERRAAVTLDVDAAVVTVDPHKGAAVRVHWTDRLAQFVPMGLAFLLFIVAFSNASLLLQSVIEEKSTRMIEVLLSCAAPHEVMTGKLIGVVALALVTVAAWSAGLLGVAEFVSRDAATVLVSGLGSLTPVLPLIAIYFFCGLLIYSAIFLGIGATTNSLPDAQALVGPASMIIVLPNMLMGALIQDPNGPLATVISWIPIYTPFFMLLRLPFHPPPVELWLTAGLVLVTTFLLVRQTGRIFARHALTTERPPALGMLMRQLFGKAARPRDPP